MSTPHGVELARDQLWGNVLIAVGGEIVRDDFRMLSLGLVVTWKFEVGTTEKHTVRIETHRPLVSAAARPQPILASVDRASVPVNTHAQQIVPRSGIAAAGPPLPPPW